MGEGTFSVLHLLKELVGWVLVTVLLHLGQVALLWGDGSIHLQGSRGGRVEKVDEERKFKDNLVQFEHVESFASLVTQFITRAAHFYI